MRAMARSMATLSRFVTSLFNRSHVAQRARSAFAPTARSFFKSTSVQVRSFRVSHAGASALPKISDGSWINALAAALNSAELPAKALPAWHSRYDGGWVSVEKCGDIKKNA